MKNVLFSSKMSFGLDIDFFISRGHSTVVLIWMAACFSLISCGIFPVECCFVLVFVTKVCFQAIKMIIFSANSDRIDSKSKILRFGRPRALQTFFVVFSTSDFSMLTKKTKSWGNSTQTLWFLL